MDTHHMDRVGNQPLDVDSERFLPPEMVRKSHIYSVGHSGHHTTVYNNHVDSQVIMDEEEQECTETNNNLINEIDLDTPDDDYEACGKVLQRSLNISSSDTETTNHTGDDAGGSNLSSVYQGEWPIDRLYWNSDADSSEKASLNGILQQDTDSIMSFNSNMTSSSVASHSQKMPQVSTKVEVVYSLLSMLGTQDKVEMSKMLLAMSSSKENCIIMSQSGCLPLLVQLLHNYENSVPANQTFTSRKINHEVRERASQALHNIVYSHPDDKRGRREARVLRLLEQIRDYSDHLRNIETDVDDNENARSIDQHLGPSVAALMKLSFDEEHRHAMCQLGGLQAIAELMQIDQEVHGCTNDEYCITIRRYAGMALTNLTFGDGTNKALLCSMKSFMKALVDQLHSPSEDLRQVTASVLRNLSWRADSASKQMLRDVGAVSTLMKAAMEATKESTLKSILSALWNLSAHCSGNKADICSIDGALAFLVSTLTYKSHSKTLAIIENGGGILRNISSHIAIQNDYRAILRKHNCLQILLHHLKSPSLTVVSNACGTLWNLSARNAEDQRSLWEMGAVGMLRNLVNSKHKMISMGSSAALKNLLSAKPPGINFGPSLHSDNQKSGSYMPSLLVRKQKALDAEIDQNLSETYDNTDSPKTSPNHHNSQDNKSVINNATQHFSCLPNCMHQNVNDKKSDSSILQAHSGIGKSVTDSSVVEHRQKGSFHVIKNSKYILDYRYIHSKPQEWKKENAPSNHASSTSVKHPAYCYNNFKTIESENYEPLSRVRSPSNLRPQYVMKKEKQKPTEEAYQSKCSGVNINQYKTEIKTNLSATPSKKVSRHVANLAQKIKNISFDDQECHYQPVNYSLKYSDEVNGSCVENPCCSSAKTFSDSKIPLPKVNNYLSRSSIPFKTLIPDEGIEKLSTVSHSWTEAQTASACHENGVNHKSATAHQSLLQSSLTYSSYAETDLDNPDQSVDYSQKYQEPDDCTSSQVLEDSRMFDSEPSKLHPASDKLSYNNEDTVKVYCTEDTPLNFSSASSLTDLHEISSSNQSTVNLDAKNKSLEEDKEQLIAMSSENDSKISVNCDEIAKNSLEAKEILSNKDNILRVHQKKVLLGTEKESKTVTFGEEINYAEETPLMFSRCSSLGSLSSFDQQSIHDDRSSVISDFSRRTSGVVSPSDLPDSPGQTMPPSPQRAKLPIFVFPTNSEEKSSNEKDFREPSLSNAICNEDEQCNNVFEDTKKAFVEEGTPFELSRTTSLSSLTIDNDPKLSKATLIKKETLMSEEIHVDSWVLEDESNHIGPSESLEKDSGSSFESSGENYKHQEGSEDASDMEENEDFLLAECISSGMPQSNKNDHTITKSQNRPVKLNSHPHHNVNPLQTNNLHMMQSNETSSKHFTTIGASAQMEPVAAISILDGFSDDSVKVYRTEGTPNLSHSASFSDLSVLSFNDEKKCQSSLNSSQDYSDSSSVCDDSDSLLLQCIKSGMPSSKKRINSYGTENNLNLAKTNGSKLKIPSNTSEITSGNIPVRHCKNSYSDGPKKSLSKISLNDDHINRSHLPKIQLHKTHCSGDSGIQKLKHFVKQPVGKHQAFDSCSVNMQFKSMSISQKDTNPPVFCDNACDSPKTFQVENTPITFSRSESLSSLSCEEDTLAEMETRHEECQKGRYHKNSDGAEVVNDLNVCERVKSSPDDDTNYNPYKMQMQPKEKSESDNSCKTQKSVENTENENKLYSVSLIDKSYEINNEESHKSNLIEGTPLCFSRNSSLSSLSVESLDEPSSSEKALLEECIRFGMPKGRLLEKTRSKTEKSSKLSSKSLQKNSEKNAQHSELGTSVINSTVKNNESKCHEKDNKECENDNISENEEKGKEDERNQEKQKLSNVASVTVEETMSVEKQRYPDTMHKHTSLDLHFREDNPDNFLKQQEECLAHLTNDNNDKVVADDQLVSPNKRDNKTKVFKNSSVNLLPVEQTNKTLMQVDLPESHIFKTESLTNHIFGESSLPAVEEKLDENQYSKENITSLHCDEDKFTLPNDNISSDIHSEIHDSNTCIDTEESLHSKLTLTQNKATLIDNSNEENHIHDQTISLLKTETWQNSDEKTCSDDFALNITNIDKNYKAVTPSTTNQNSDIIYYDPKYLGTNNLPQYLDNVPSRIITSEIKEYKIPDNEVNTVGGVHSKEITSIPEISLRGKDKLEAVIDSVKGEMNSKTLTKIVNTEITEKNMVSAAITSEAQQIAEYMAEAGVDTSEDMTVSTVSCISDIDSTKPPSIMGDLASLSMTNSGFSNRLKNSANKTDEVCKKECNKCHKKYSHIPATVRRALLNELHTVGSNSEEYCDCKSKLSLLDSTDSMKSSTASDILENINPPSVMDDISLTASTGSLNSFESNILDNSPGKMSISTMSSKNDMAERLNEAAALVHLYTKELSNITGNCVKSSGTSDVIDQVKPPSAFQEITEITIEDATEIAYDTIGSDTELEDELPCDDEDTGSDTLQAPQLTSLSKDEPGEGSTENLTLTLTEEPPILNNSNMHLEEEGKCYEDDMSAEQFKVLQENADLIVSTLNTIQFSECNELGVLPQSEMLEDETLSLVSNESDEDNLSPDFQGIQQRELTVNKMQQLHKDGSPNNVCQTMLNAASKIKDEISDKKSLSFKKQSSLPIFSSKSDSSIPDILLNTISSKNSVLLSEKVNKFKTSVNNSCDSDLKTKYIEHSTVTVKENRKLRPPSKAIFTRLVSNSSNEPSVNKDKIPVTSTKNELLTNYSADIPIKKEVHIVRNASAEGGYSTDNLVPNLVPEDKNLPLKKFVDSKTYIKRKKCEVACSMASSQKKNIENKSHQNQICSSLPHYNASESSTSNSLSSLSSSGDISSTKINKPIGSKKQVSSKLAATWKNSNKIRAKNSADSNRYGKGSLDRSTLSSGSSSSISSKDGDRSIPSRFYRSSSQTSSPQQSLSRSSTFEKLSEENDMGKRAIKRPTTLMLSKKSDVQKHTTSKSSIMQNKINSDVSISAMNAKDAQHISENETNYVREPIYSRKEKTRCSAQYVDPNLSPSSPSRLPTNGSVSKGTQPNKIQASASSRKSMIPTPSKIPISGVDNEKETLKNNVYNPRNDCGSGKQRTCLVTMV